MVEGLGALESLSHFFLQPQDSFQKHLNAFKLNGCRPHPEEPQNT